MVKFYYQEGLIMYKASLINYHFSDYPREVIRISFKTGFSPDDKCPLSSIKDSIQQENDEVHLLFIKTFKLNKVRVLNEYKKTTVKGEVYWESLIYFPRKLQEKADIFISLINAKKF